MVDSRGRILRLEILGTYILQCGVPVRKPEWETVQSSARERRPANVNLARKLDPTIASTNDNTGFSGTALYYYYTCKTLVNNLDR